MVTKNKVKGKDIPPSYYEKLAMVESSGNPNAKAKCPPGVNCTASGLYQFTEETWNEMVEQAGLDYTLKDRFDPDKSLEVVKRFTQRNKKYLEKKLGREVTQNELYLAHFLGMGGSRKMLEAYQEFPELTADRVIGEGSVNSNPNVFLNKDGSVKTLREIYKWSADKFGVKGVEVPKDDVIWSLDENGNYVNVNPEFATEAQREASNYMKQQYINTLYPEADTTNTKKTTTDTEQTPQQTKESVEDEEIPQWKQELNEKQEQRDIIMDFITQGGFKKQELNEKQEQRDEVMDFITQGGLNKQTVDYKRQPISIQEQPNSYQEDGGTFPVSKNGLYDYPKQPVRVPTKDGKITMKGIDYPVLGIANTGEEILMQPNKEYHFEGATEVLEIPIN